MDAIIVTASRVGSLYLPLLERLSVPVVLINNQQEGPYIHSVGTDNLHGGRLAAGHLVNWDTNVWLTSRALSGRPRAGCARRARVKCC